MANRSQPVAEQFEEVFKTHFSRIYNYVYYRVGNPSVAEDLCADIFVRAYEYWGSYSPEKGSIGAWLGAIARNTVYTHFRKYSSQPKSTPITENMRAVVNIEDEFLHRETMRELLSQMKLLSCAHQELLEMKYLLRLTNRDIAKATGMSESNVGSTLHRIIGRLAKKIPQ